MDYIVSLTEEEVIALQTLTGPGGDVQNWIQSQISNLAKNQVNNICAAYSLDKLTNNKRIGFTNKKDTIMSAKNEGFIEANFLNPSQS